MLSLRCTLEQRWSLKQAAVSCFVAFTSAFDSIDKDFLWRIMAADGMPPELLKPIKAFYASTKMKTRASGGASVSFEIRSGV